MLRGPGNPLLRRFRENAAVIDLLAIMFTVLTIVGLTILVTLIDLQINVALKALAGLAILTAAISTSTLLQKFISPVRIEALPPRPETTFENTLVIAILSLLSFGAQIAIIISAPPDAQTVRALETVTISGNQVIGGVFYEGMAMAEEWFFRFLLFRLFWNMAKRGLQFTARTAQQKGTAALFAAVLAALVTSSMFALYHGPVYSNQEGLLGAAFVGSFAYCMGFALAKQRLSVPMVMHGAQNLPIQLAVIRVLGIVA